MSLRAIRRSAADHYRPREIEAWAGRRSVAGHRWMIHNTAVLLAEVNGEVAGFAGVALQQVGHLQVGEVDQLFVDPDSGGRGIARLLLTSVASLARAAGLTALHTHASWRAVPAFERLGYERVEVEAVELSDVTLTRVLMRTRL
nr:GNAT family N-acetyltransferase [Geodermatophilus tzadiensis]